MTRTELQARQALIEYCRMMNHNGLNQGTSGNISIRYEDCMLISPSAIPYDLMEPEMICARRLRNTGDQPWEGPRKPSTEWRFHYALLLNRPEAGAVLHAHPTYCTTLAIHRKSIPACHYMVAAFGGHDVRCTDYDTFGTARLAEMAIEAMRDRSACLLANHGMIVVGGDLRQAMWRAVELETIARQYFLSLQIGAPHILSTEQIDETLALFADYGGRQTDD